MTTEHPITPPSQELVRKWIEDWAGGQMKGPVTEDQLVVASQAARWGADQELDAVCNYIAKKGKWFADPDYRLEELRITRRSKPPSLAEQALEAQQRVWNTGSTHADWELIRAALAALERLKKLEKGNE